MSENFGRLFVDLVGPELTAEDREILQHPEVGGVIFFSRHFIDPDQCVALVDDIRSCRPELILTVDQEGGRVQRFKNGLVRLPAVGKVARSLTEKSAADFNEQLQNLAWLMATEVLNLGVDLSFAPVADIDYGNNEVIGDRAFASDAENVNRALDAYLKGLEIAGMPATLKHFPGHGWVNADSHVALPIDNRPFTEIQSTDLKPFARWAKRAQLIMPAHVVYPECDSLPAGFSSFWLKTQLRKALGFQGRIISDDLCMVGAHSLGEVEDRAVAAVEAGCDLLLVCNRRDQVIRLLDAGLDLTGAGNLSDLRGKVRPVAAPRTINAQIVHLEKQFAPYLDETLQAQQKSIGESHA